MAEAGISQNEALRYERLAFYAGDAERLNEAMIAFVRKSGARCCLLIDRDGHLVAKQGFADALNTSGLAALIAGSFASTAEVARLLGDTSFHDLMHQGSSSTIHIALVGERSLQVAVFNATTKPGLIQIMTKELAGRLDAILTEIRNRKPVDSPETTLAENFSAEMKGALDGLFGGL